MSIFSNIMELAASTFGLGGRMRRRSFPTMSGRTHVYEITYDDGQPVRVMNVQGTYQSATYLEDDCYKLVFGYHRVYDAMFGTGVPLRSVAMLGGGGFSYPKHLVAHHPDVSVDVVEIDPAVVAIAQRWFYLDRLVEEFETDATGRLGIYVEDARAYLEEPGRSYDAIVNDCFSARVPAMALATEEAARCIHARLNPGGLYLTNVISALRGPDAKLLHSVVATLAQEFAHVHVIPGSEGLPRRVDNYVVVATDSGITLPHQIDVQPEPGTKPLVDAFIEDYEEEFFLFDT